VHKVNAVFNQVSPVSGEYRLRSLEWIGGEHRTETLYREAGCVFKVDLSTVYFSPRLSFERMRVARLVKAGEVVVNMFSGVGSFSILIAKHSSPAKVYSIDVNPRAVELMRENIELNNVQRIVEAMQGDAREIAESALRGVADRVLMPLPEKAPLYLKAAIGTLKVEGGVIHYYDFVHSGRSENPVTKAMDKVAEKLADAARAYSVESARVVRSVGPHWYQVVLDIHAIPSV
jgi:tRNA (guanine37-N1)-methyltransferase